MATLNLQCAESGDDAIEALSDGDTFLTLSTLQFGVDVIARHIGLRFPGVSGLAGATINSATLTFRATSTESGAFEGDWFGVDAESPPIFVGQGNGFADFGVSSLARTTATCEGDGTDFGNHTAGSDHTFTGDGVNTIADIIQELADNYDPTAIALVHILQAGSNTGERVVQSWDGDNALAPKLDIDYTPAAGGAAIRRYSLMTLGVG